MFLLGLLDFRFVIIKRYRNRVLDSSNYDLIALLIKLFYEYKLQGASVGMAPFEFSKMKSVFYNN